MINAEEKEEEEKNIVPQREQEEQVPIRDIDVPLQDEPLIAHSQVINDHPFRRPTESSVHVEPSETDYQGGRYHIRFRSGTWRRTPKTF